MRKDTVPPRPKDMMESLTPEQRQAIFQKAKQVEKSAQQIQQEKQLQTKRRNQALASSMMFNPDADVIVPGISDKQVKTLSQEKQEQTTKQKKLVKRTAQGTVKKAITTEYGTFDYEASPEESKILELGGQEANDLLVKIANYYRDEFKKQNVPIKESRKGFADLWEAGLNPESVDVQGQLKTNLKETFAPYTPLLPRLALEKVSGALGSKGQELLQSENMAAKGVGLVTSIGASIAEDLSNPLAAFAYDTGNLYDPTATAEERGGAAFNVVTKYALPAIAPLGAAQAGIKAFKAGQTVEQALTTASRALLRSSLGALGKKIDTAVYSKVPLNKLLDVLEAEGQMMGKTRAALSKELADAGKTFAKETGKGVDEFYTRYLNDYAEGKAQLTSSGRVPPPIIEPVKAPEAPTQAEDLGTVVDDLVGKTEPETNTITVYHGTTGEFEGVPSVSMSRTGAIHVTPDKKFAENFTDINQPNAVGQVPTIKEFDLDKSKIADLSQPELKQDFIDFVINKYGLKSDPLDPEFQTLNTRTFDPEGYNYPGGMTIDDLANDIDKGQFWVAESEAAKEWSKTKGYSGVKAIEDGSETYALFDTDALNVKTLPTPPPTSIVDEIEQGMGASKSTAPPPPTEPTVTGIPETPDEQLTSAKNRMIQEVRDEYDMGKFDEPTRRKWEESLTTAKQELQSNANAVDNVIAKIDSKRAINEAEQSVLVVALSRERRNARILLEQTNNATSPEEIATLAEQTKIAEDRIDNYTNALNRAGSETARTLNARRAVIDAAEDLVSIRAKARQTYGKTLEAADEEAVTDIGTKLEDINKQIDDATGKGTTPVETVKANTRVKGIKESAPKLQPKADAKRVKQFESVINRVKEKLDAFVRPSTIETMGVPTEVDIWQPRLNDPASQTYFKQLASVQNDMGKVIQKLVVDELIEDFDTLLARLQADGFNITDTDLKLILSADYPTTKLYDFSDIETEYVKMVRRQLAQEAKGSSVAERGRLIKNIQKLSQKLQSNVRKVTDKTLKTAFEENIDSQNRLDDLQAESNVKGQIDKLKEQIADPVLVDRIKREVPQYIQDLVHQREILRGQLNDKLRELADKKFREEHPYLNALEVAAKIPTELLVSLDNSAAFTHGAFRSIRNPLKWTKATSKSFQALISDGKYKDILASVRTRDNYDDMVRAGVAGIKQRDLQDATMYASVLQKVPYVGTLFKRSNAAMEVFGAVIRSDYFDALTEASRKEYLRGKITRAELLDRYKLHAEMVNTVTGKGIKELPRPVSVIAPFANFGMSRVKTATMTPFFNAIAKGDKVAARQFATEYFKYASTYMGLLKIAEMNGLEVGIDPRDPEYFGKIKLPGIDKWWDMSGGILEPYRILINTKPVRNITGAEESKYKTITNFAEGKLGAPAKTAMNVFQGMTGETPYGRNYDVRTDEGRLNVLMDNLPINVKTGKEVVESDKSLGAKAAESGLQFMGARLIKDKGSKARQPVTPGVTP